MEHLQIIKDNKDSLYTIDKAIEDIKYAFEELEFASINMIMINYRSNIKKSLFVRLEIFLLKNKWYVLLRSNESDDSILSYEVVRQNKKGNIHFDSL